MFCSPLVEKRQRFIIMKTILRLIKRVKLSITEFIQRIIIAKPISLLFVDNREIYSATNEQLRYS